MRVFLDVIFPPTDDALRLRDVSDDALVPLRSVGVHHGIYTLLPFHHPLVRAAIHETKYHYNQKAVRMLAHVLREHFKMIDSEVVIIPVPLSRTRLYERGYNQVSEVTRRAIQEQLAVSLEEGTLKRLKNTKPQTELPKDARVRNVANAFGVKDGTRIRGKRIILIDDVVTTGATVGAAKAALLPHRPASVTCIALAH